MPETGAICAHHQMDTDKHPMMEWQFPLHGFGNFFGYILTTKHPVLHFNITYLEYLTQRMSIQWRNSIRARKDKGIGTRFLSRKIQRAFRMRPVRPRPALPPVLTEDLRGGKEMGKYCRWGKIVRGKS
jgi:hypothetical protein